MFNAMKKRKIGFIICIVAMVLCALVSVAGVIIFYAKATATNTLPLALLLSGLGGVIVSIAAMFLVIPKNKEDK